MNHSINHILGANSATSPTCAERIHALTSLLNDLSCHHPFSNIDPLDPEGHPELRSYYYLATLLTTGIHEHNCAVTAISLPGVVKCIIADSGDAKHDKPAANTHSKVRIRVVAEGTTDLDRLGSSPSDPDSVSFEEHVGDVCHALRSFHNAMQAMSMTPGTPSPYWAFLRFIVRRCHLKIAERMLNGEKIWKVHPIVVLRSWYPSSKSFERQEFPVRHQILQSVLSLYGIQPIQEGKQDGHGEDRNSHSQRYYFATDNARSWAQVMCVLYGVLEKHLFTPYFDGTIPPKSMPRASMDVDSIATVADYLDTFAVMLDLPPIRDILAHELFVSKLELLDSEDLPTEQDYKNGHDNTTTGLSKDEERESAGEHVYRYLRAIVAWVIGVLHLTQNEALRNNILIQVYRVHIPPNINTRPSPSALKALREEVLAELPKEDTERAQVYLDGRIQRLRSDKTKHRSCVHNEAVLMSILFSHKLESAVVNLRAAPDVRLHNEIGSLASVFQQGYIAISGTHNCCFSCWWLADALSKSGPGVDILLTGTHGLMRPWSPPDVGLSDDEAKLQDLEAFLMSKLHAECTTRRDAKENGVSKEHHHMRRRLLSHLSFGLFG